MWKTQVPVRRWWRKRRKVILIQNGGSRSCPPFCVAAHRVSLESFNVAGPWRWERLLTSRCPPPPFLFAAHRVSLEDFNVAGPWRGERLLTSRCPPPLLFLLADHDPR